MGPLAGRVVHGGDPTVQYDAVDQRRRGQCERLRHRTQRDAGEKLSGSRAGRPPLTRHRNDAAFDDPVLLLRWDDRIAGQLALNDQLARLRPVDQHRRTGGDAWWVRRRGQVVLDCSIERRLTPVAECRCHDVRGGGQCRLAVAQYVGQPPEMEL